MHLNKYLDSLKTKLPEIVTDRDLVEHLPNFFRNPSTITRMRQQGLCPAFFAVPPHIYYLRNDVLDWLKNRYQGQEGQATQAKPRTSHKRSSKQPAGDGKGARK